MNLKTWKELNSFFSGRPPRPALQPKRPTSDVQMDYMELLKPFRPMVAR